jgi:3-phosphoshikimate 1-carboxyvinyltransferase
LKIKETDRIAALIAESKKMGFLLHEVSEGVLAWEGERCPTAKPICIDTYEDHRMAMAFAPAVFKLGDICINNPQVVTKSYPQFWEELSKFVTFVS